MKHPELDSSSGIGNLRPKPIDFYETSMPDIDHEKKWTEFQRYKAELLRHNPDLERIINLADGERDEAMLTHSERVAYLQYTVVDLADMNDTKKAEARQVGVINGLIHDIGKLHKTVHPVVNSPDIITADDPRREILNSHGVIGLEVIREELGWNIGEWPAIISGKPEYNEVFLLGMIMHQQIPVDEKRQLDDMAYEHLILLNTVDSAEAMRDRGRKYRRDLSRYGDNVIDLNDPNAVMSELIRNKTISKFSALTVPTQTIIKVALDAHDFWESNDADSHNQIKNLGSLGVDTASSITNTTR